MNPVDPICDFQLPLPSKETYKSYTPDAKLDTVYDLLCVALQNQRLVVETLEKRKKYDTTIAAIMGFLGGAAAITAQSFVHYLKPK
jgi:hypothetical protein